MSRSKKAYVPQVVMSWDKLQSSGEPIIDETTKVPCYGFMPVFLNKADAVREFPKETIKTIDIG